MKNKKVYILRIIIIIFTSIISIIGFIIGYKMINRKSLLIVSIDSISENNSFTNEISWQEFEKMLDRFKRYNYVKLNSKDLNDFLNNKIDYNRLFLITLNGNISKNYDVIIKLYKLYDIKVIMFINQDAIKNLLINYDKEEIKDLIEKLKTLHNIYETQIGLELNKILYEDNINTEEIIQDVVLMKNKFEEATQITINYFELPKYIIFDENLCKKFLDALSARFLFTKMNELLYLEKCSFYIPRIVYNNLERDGFTNFLISPEARKGSLIITISFFMVLLIIKDILKIIYL